MVGSFWAPIVIPIVASLALFAWLGSVYYAAAHPRWRNQPAAPPPQQFTSIREPLEAAEPGEPAVTPGAPAPAGPPAATAPQPRAPSESEQLARKTGDR